MPDVYADISIVYIENSFVEFSGTKTDSTLVGFDHNYISNKSTPIGAAETDINLSNGTIIYQMNYTQLIHGGTKPLLSKTRC